MAQVIWTEPALNNLDEIAEYIALSNPVAAVDLVQRVFNTMDRLELFPESGRIPEEINDLNYREIVVNPVRVFYKLQEEIVHILYVFPQERDVKKYIVES